MTETEVHSTLETLRPYAPITQDTTTAAIRIHALTARAVQETIPNGTLAALARTAADAVFEPVAPP
ncbi:hypothetical protein ABZ517_10765 [Streptomyces scabiei]|uniref:hypothetical protein n=1 Tax=Streptomyces scabiei TaxID=1930 RepID=UPI0033E98181